MRRILLIFILTFSVAAHSTSAQDAGWCGYALIEGLPLLANQLAPLEAITPDKSPGVQPSALFQYRFSLDHSQVIVEGCWKVAPSREVIVTLLAQSVNYDSKVMADQVDQAIQQAVIKGDQQVTTADVVRAYVDDNMTYTLFAPGGTREDSAAAARAYIEANLKAWELDEE